MYNAEKYFGLFFWIVCFVIAVVAYPITIGYFVEINSYIPISIIIACLSFFIYEYSWSDFKDYVERLEEED